MFFNRRRLEEDLERIRRAGLSPEAREALEAEETEEKKRISEAMRSGEMKVTAKDVLAMTIAIFSLILPPLLIILAGMGLVLFWFLR